ncbi:MAG TPA: lactate utilization protein C [Solirubrobacterales bacterium]|nr:lactate utilization protein C [Solirubrobacterales bacterium]
MSAARDEILGRVRAALADASADEPTRGDEPPAYEVSSDLEPAALADLFAARVAEYRAKVRRTDRTGIANAVVEALETHAATRIAIPPSLPAPWRPGVFELVEDSPDSSPQDLEQVDAALTGCALAIAETGTFVLDSGPDQGRRALTLVPDLHVCVVEAERIVGTVPEAIRALEAGAREGRRPLTFVSGPSATSDIELNRVEGVHGPRRLEVVVAG